MTQLHTLRKAHDAAHHHGAIPTRARDGVGIECRQGGFHAQRQRFISHTFQNMRTTPLLSKGLSDHIADSGWPGDPLDLPGPVSVITA